MWCSAFCCVNCLGSVFTINTWRRHNTAQLPCTLEHHNCVLAYDMECRLFKLLSTRCYKHPANVDTLTKHIDSLLSVTCKLSQCPAFVTPLTHCFSLSSMLNGVPCVCLPATCCCPYSTSDLPQLDGDASYSGGGSMTQS